MKVHANAVSAKDSGFGEAEAPTEAQIRTYDAAGAAHVALSAEETEATKISRVVAVGARLVTGFERAQYPADKDRGGSSYALTTSADLVAMTGGFSK